MAITSWTSVSAVSQFSVDDMFLARLSLDHYNYELNWIKLSNAVTLLIVVVSFFLFDNAVRLSLFLLNATWLQYLHVTLEVAAFLTEHH